MGDEGMPIYPLAWSKSPPKSQISLATGIQLAIPKGHIATISSHENPSPQEPLVCSGILDPAYADELVLRVGNLTGKPLVVDPRVPIAFIRLLSVNDIAGLAPCGSLCDLGLPNPSIHVTLPPLDESLAPSDHAEALALLEEYAELFS